MAGTTQRESRRGPKPKQDRGTPSGYRVTDRVRFELGMASLFTGTKSLQDTIDLAVSEFLSKLHTNAGFSQALLDAEQSRLLRLGIPSIPRPEDSDR